MTDRKRDEIRKIKITKPVEFIRTSTLDIKRIEEGEVLEVIISDIGMYVVSGEYNNYNRANYDFIKDALHQLENGIYYKKEVNMIKQYAGEMFESTVRKEIDEFYE